MKSQAKSQESLSVSSDPLCDLKVIEQLSLKVVEASPDALIAINEAGKIVIFNEQAELLFGYAREEILGLPVEMLLPESKRESHSHYRDSYFEGPRVREMGPGLMLEGLHRSGKHIPIQIKLAPLSPVKGAGVHALAVVRRVSSSEKHAVSMQVVKESDIPNH